MGWFKKYSLESGTKSGQNEQIQREKKVFFQLKKWTLTIFNVISERSNIFPF